MDDASTPNDEELMRMVRLGSREAFLELMRRWQDNLYRFFRLSRWDHHESEDCVQETFLRVFAYRKRYRTNGRGTFRSFLFRIGRNVSIDLHRRKKRVRETSPLAGLLEREPTADPTQLWRDSLDVRESLLSLSQRLRLVVILNVFEGLSYREVAETLEIPIGTVKSRMYHAVAQLREALGVELSV